MNPVSRFSWFAPLMLILGISGCEQRAMDSAREADSVEGYAQFIETYPDSEHVAEATSRIDHLESQALLSGRDIAAVERWVAAHPDSEHLPLLTAHADSLQLNACAAQARQTLNLWTDPRVESLLDVLRMRVTNEEEMQALETAIARVLGVVDWHAAPPDSLESGTAHRVQYQLLQELIGLRMRDLNELETDQNFLTPLLGWLLLRGFLHELPWHQSEEGLEILSTSLTTWLAENHGVEDPEIPEALSEALNRAEQHKNLLGRLAETAPQLIGAHTRMLVMAEFSNAPLCTRLAAWRSFESLMNDPDREQSFLNAGARQAIARVMLRSGDARLVPARESNTRLAAIQSDLFERAQGYADEDIEPEANAEVDPETEVEADAN